MRRLRDFYSLTGQRRKLNSYLRIKGSLKLYVDVLDMRTYMMVIPQFEHGDAELLLAQVITPPAGVLVDVGANLGALSLFALNDEISEVHSIEPNPPMMALLERTREACPYSSKWALHPFALGAQQGVLQLFVDSNFSGTASLDKDWQDPSAKPIRVDVTTLDLLRQAERISSIDCIKIDVEGWENEVLRGSLQTLRTDRPYIWFEHNLTVLKRTGSDPSSVLNTLQESGYGVFYDISRLPSRSGYSPRDIDSLKEGRFNFLAVPSEREDDFVDRVLPAMNGMVSGENH